MIPMNGTTHFLATSVKKLSAALDSVAKLCHLFIYIILFYSIFA